MLSAPINCVGKTKYGILFYSFSESSKVSGYLNVLPFLSARITRTQVSDGGTYTCVASNRAGVDNRHYNLQVHGECENLHC